MMHRKTRGLIAGMVGFLAGALATQMVAWQPMAKVGLAAVVCATVSVILLLCTAGKASGRKPTVDQS